MAEIKFLRVKARFNKKNAPKIMFFHKDNFNNYTTQKHGKYNVILLGDYQKDKYIDNRIKAYSDTFRFHTKRA